MNNFTSRTVEIMAGHSLIDHYIDNEPTPFVNVKKNLVSQEPYLFFGPESTKMRTNGQITHPNYRYYNYLVFNGGFRNPKEAIFKKLGYIEISDNEYEKNIEDVLISEIPRDALDKLKDFLDKQRKQYPSFCNTIYTAVETQY